MEKIGTFLIFVLQCVYTTLPAIAANVAPIICKDLPILRYPMDFGISFKGERLLGDHKTFRGLFVGVVFSMFIITVEYLIYKFTGFDFTVHHFEVNFLFLGFLMGFGVIMGDAIKSLIKRRFHIPSGKSFIPWDQIDCVLGGLVFGRIAWAYDWSYALVIIFMTFFLHILIRHFAFFLGLCDSRW